MQPKNVSPGCYMSYQVLDKEAIQSLKKHNHKMLIQKIWSCYEIQYPSDVNVQIVVRIKYRIRRKGSKKTIIICFRHVNFPTFFDCKAHKLVSIHHLFITVDNEDKTLIYVFAAESIPWQRNGRFFPHNTMTIPSLLPPTNTREMRLRCFGGFRKQNKNEIE